MNVTTTSSRAGKFESRFWHKLFEEEVGRVKGHLCVAVPKFAKLTSSGPINTLAVHPQGKAYASGAEDGFVRVHWVSSAADRYPAVEADSSSTSRTSGAGPSATSSPRLRCRLDCSCIVCGMHVLDIFVLVQQVVQRGWCNGVGAERYGGRAAWSGEGMAALAEQE
jgi:hypothetical protein